MQRKLDSLSSSGMHAFKETTLPPGEKTVGLKWVFALKTDADGARIEGKEKARVVAQGFNQRPMQYNETYAPVACGASVRIILAFATVKNLEVLQFDCKIAFLHAKLRHTVYAHIFPGYIMQNPGTGKVLRLLVALYGLRQSAYKFYMLLLCLFLGLGLKHCEADHGVFYDKWMTLPDSSILMPKDGSPLILLVPLHVDDGLGVTNSKPLYQWFLCTLSSSFNIVDMGKCGKFLGMVIIRDKPNRRLWLLAHVYIAELLEEWNLTNCKTAKTPFPSKPPDVSGSVPLPEISDAKLLPKYQRLVGCILFICNLCPEVAFPAMWLGQHASLPKRIYLLYAKHVLRYLAGTKYLSLCLGQASPSAPQSMTSFMQANGCTDADWASDTSDRKSVSGYAFFFLGSLILWSAVKQKCVTLLSMEAEYYAMSHAFKEALWLCVFLCSIDLPVPHPFPIRSDNQVACTLSELPAIFQHSKHIDICHHFICKHVREDSFLTTWIPIQDMPADIFTKALGPVR